jgi:serine protease inhibitor
MKNIVNLRLIVFFLGLITFLTSCKKEKQTEQPGDPVKIITEVYQNEVISSANKFAFDLFRPALASAKGNENILISPFSITSALSMTLNGAAGETFESMRKTLGLEQKTLEQINSTYVKLMTEMVPVDKRVIVEIANSVWVEKRLIVKQPFILELQNYFKAEARNIDVNDPEALNIVNGWIAEKTHDKITKMLDKLDPDLAMLLINAVYFNGKWRYQFDKAETKEEPFYLTPGNSKIVPMMHQKENLKAFKNSIWTLAEVPYGQGNYSMVVALPNENLSLSEAVSSLTPSLWQEWLGLLAENTHKVDLSMPRFKYMYNRPLNGDLIALGMGIAFSDIANFNNISNQQLHISRVLHQTFIDTSEEGTEAAAATVVEVSFTTAGPSPEAIKVTLDHPFLFFIRETSTGTILFMGKVSDPTLN